MGFLGKGRFESIAQYLDSPYQKNYRNIINFIMFVNIIIITEK